MKMMCFQQQTLENCNDNSVVGNSVKMTTGFSKWVQLDNHKRY